MSHTTTEAAIANLTVTIPSGGRDLLLKIIVPQVQGTTGDRLVVKFKEGSTILQRFYHGLTTPGYGEVFEGIISAPAPGSHTYTVTGQVDIGSGICTWYNDSSGSSVQFIAELL